MKVAKTIHVGASIVSGPASQVAPELKFKSKNGEEPFLLGFVEQAPDGGQEAHLYALDQGGKEKIIKHLTGGIVPASVGALADLPKMAVPKGRPH